MAGTLKELSIKSKMLAMLLLASLSSVAVLGYLGYQSGKTTLTTSIFNQLDSLRATKKQQIEWYFENFRRSVRALGKDENNIQSLLEFSTGFAALGQTKPDRESRERLEKFYKDKFIPKVVTTSEGSKLPAVYWPRSWAAQKLQSMYISSNPHGVGEKDKLETSSQKSAYATAHTRRHKHFLNVLQLYGFYDIFLIDAKSGAIVYSVTKEADFGTSLRIGPYANSNLAKLFAKISSTHFPGQVKLADFSFYPPSYNAPASFAGTPLYKNGEFVGVLAIQISDSALNSFLTGGGGWQREGLGKTGEVYFVGPDRLMRSQSRFLARDRKKFLSALQDLALPKDQIEKIRRLNTTILLKRVDTKSVDAALHGRSGTHRSRNYRGAPVLSSFSPTDTGGLRWVIVAEKEEAEALGPVRAFQRNVLIAACIIALLTTLAAMALAAAFLKPVSSLLDGISRLRGGDTDVELDVTSKDEFGQLTLAFNKMVGEIKTRDEVIQGKSKAYSALLHRIFPDAVAERMRKGEAQFIDKFSNVSTIYVTLNGFTDATEGLEPEEERAFLNDLQDSFDDIADELGIEKVKTIGEHYLAVCGLSIPRLDHASRAVKFALKIFVEVQRLNKSHAAHLALRVGIHSGEVHAGLIGQRRIVYDIWGHAVNIATRIVYEAEPGTVRVTETTHSLLHRTTDFSQKEVVVTKAMGTIGTYQMSLDKTANKKKLAQQHTSSKSPGASSKTNAAE